MSLITIELKDLHFFAALGLHKEEERVENEFKVDIAIAFQAPEKTITSIHDTLNYVAIYQMVQGAFVQKKALLETCAMQIAGSIKEQFPFVKNIDISIQKINPPITSF